MTPAQQATPPQQQPAWMRAACPRCGGELVSVQRYVPGQGYVNYYACPGWVAERRTCDYRRVL